MLKDGALCYFDGKTRKGVIPTKSFTGAKATEDSFGSNSDKKMPCRFSLNTQERTFYFSARCVVKCCRLGLLLLLSLLRQMNVKQDHEATCVHMKISLVLSKRWNLGSGRLKVGSALTTQVSAAAWLDDCDRMSVVLN